MRRGWVFPVALGLQCLGIYLAASMPALVYPALMGISYSFLLLGVVNNLNLWGFRLLLVGLLLNLAALLVHGGYMPVTPEALLEAGFSPEAHLESGSYLVGSKSILLARKDTRVWFLTDVFPLAAPVRRVFSIGDVIVATAALVLLGQIIWNRVKHV